MHITSTTIMSARHVNFTTASTLLTSAADFTPCDTSRYIIHISAEAKSTICHEWHMSAGKKAPTESLSITA